jgi:hypothetical protein
MTAATKQQQAREAARKARAMAAKLEAAAGISSERDRQNILMTKKRREGRTVEVRTLTPEQRDQRDTLEQDDAAWLRFFFCDLFTYEFTGQQEAMITAIGDAIHNGGDQAIAASRGEGKTTIAECVLTKYVLSGTCSFAVLFAATGSKAADSLKNIKDAIDAMNGAKILGLVYNQATYDTFLSAYTGSCGALTEIACNDDAAGCGGFSSVMAVAVEAGQDYLIRVGGFGGGAGSGVRLLRWRTRNAGSAASSARVYGWRAPSGSAETGIFSTILPAYITSSRSAK